MVLCQDNLRRRVTCNLRTHDPACWLAWEIGRIQGPIHIVVLNPMQLAIQDPVTIDHIKGGERVRKSTVDTAGTL